MKTMVRRVQDDFEALMMCNSFEECGGVPVSVVYQSGAADQFGALPAWHVFGRVEEHRFDDVDKAFSRLMVGKR